MAENSQNSNIPEKIKIGEVEYTVKDHPELLTLIESVRKQEKTKLNSEIRTLEATKTDLENKLKSGDTLTTAQKQELEKAKADLAVAQNEKSRIEGELEGLKKAKEGKEPEPKPTGGLTLEAVTQLLAKQKAELAEEFDKRVATVQSNLGKVTTEQYLKEVLEKNAGVVIPALVKGSTKEEIDQSLVEALQVSKNYITVDHAGKKVTLAEKEAIELAARNAPPVNPTNPGIPPVAPGQSGNGDFTDKSLVKDVSKMSAAEYAKHREGIMREVGQMTIVEAATE
jgi:chromosome segregation ATPase